MTGLNNTSRLNNETFIKATYEHLATELNCKDSALQHMRWYNMGSYALIPERSFDIISNAFSDKKVTPDFIESLKGFLLKAQYSRPDIDISKFQR